MTFSRANALGWGMFEVLTSTQMNALDIDHSNALDGLAGGIYDIGANILTISGSGGTINLATTTVGVPSGTTATWASGSTLTVAASAGFNLNGAGLIGSGGALSVQSGGDLFVLSGGTATVLSGASMIIDGGGALSIEGGITIQDAAGGGPGAITWRAGSAVNIGTIAGIDVVVSFDRSDTDFTTNSTVDVNSGASWTFNNTPTVASGMTLSGGLLSLTSTSALTMSGSGALTIGSSNAATFNGSVTLTGAVALQDPMTLSGDGQLIERVTVAVDAPITTGVNVTDNIVFFTTGVLSGPQDWRLTDTGAVAGSKMFVSRRAEGSAHTITVKRDSDSSAIVALATGATLAATLLHSGTRWELVSLDID